MRSSFIFPSEPELGATELRRRTIQSRVKISENVAGLIAGLAFPRDVDQDDRRPLPPGSTGQPTEACQ